MRYLSQTVKDTIAQGYIEVVDLVEVTLPAYSYWDGTQTISYSEIVFNLSGYDIDINGKPYKGSLRSIGQIRSSMGSSPDSASFDMENVSREKGHLLTTNRKLDNGRATISRAFKTPDGWEISELFTNGYIKNIKIDGEKISFSVDSEMGRKGANVAERPVTQRCYWKFKGFGCLWTPAQPGDENYCSRERDTLEGCAGHGNLTQFGAVPQFSILPPVGGTMSGYDNFYNGFSDPDLIGWCIEPKSLVKVWKNDKIYRIEADKIQKGDALVSANLFGTLEKSEVLDVLRGTTSQLFTIHTESASITCSPQHPLITSLGDSKGTPARDLKIDDTLICLNDKNVLKEKIIAIEIVNTKSDVITFTLKEFNTFFAGNGKNAILNHNLKPINNLSNFQLNLT